LQLLDLLSARYADDGHDLKGGRMPTQSAVVRLNLEYYRRQAKALLRAGKAGQAKALQRIRLYSFKLNHTELPALHDAQLTIARELGFPGWPSFKSFITESNLNFQELVAAFIDAAVSDGTRAEALLTANPKIAEAGFYVALVLGDWRQVERTIVEAPALVHARSGPQNCEPLIYVCFSRFADGKATRAPKLAETARVLLRHGADPNAFLLPRDLPNNPLSCLYAATGLNNNADLGLALLEDGANPNDNESLYHATEHHDLASMKVLLRYGAKPNGSNALKHMLDREDTEGLQLLLDAGADPNETNERGDTALHWAVWRGRTPKTITTLLDYGSDLNARRRDGRTAYALAILSGQKEVAALLKSRGTPTDLSALDQFVDDSVNGGHKPLAAPPDVSIQPTYQHLIPHLASVHYTSAVRALLAAGLPIDARGEHGGSALHWACWKGYADLVKLLIDHHAPLNITDETFHATPSGWLHHGTQNCGEPSGDYAEVARLLVAAGASMEGCNTPTGNTDVDAVLREHKLIE
jgi:ankyrin repeat protein